MIDGLFKVRFTYEQHMIKEIGRTPSLVVLCGMCNHLWSKSGNCFDTVSIDVYQGMYDAVKHLIKMGHRNIGYVAGRKDTVVYQQRYEAYKDALRDHGIPYREECVSWNDWNEIGGYNSGRALYQLPDRPTAICASNDLQAIGCWRNIRDMGARCRTTSP